MAHRNTSPAVTTGDPASMNEDRRRGPEGAGEERLEEVWGDSRASAHPQGFWKYFGHLKTVIPT